jgi:hypothetical protein
MIKFREKNVIFLAATKVTVRKFKALLYFLNKLTRLWKTVVLFFYFLNLLDFFLKFLNFFKNIDFPK